MLKKISDIISLASLTLLMSMGKESQSAEQIDGDVGIKDRSNLTSTRMNEAAAMMHLRDDLLSNDKLDWGRILAIAKREKDYVEKGYGKRTRHTIPSGEMRQRQEAAMRAEMVRQEMERQRLAAIEEQRQKDLRAAQEGVMPVTLALEEEREKLRQQSAEALRSTGTVDSSRLAIAEKDLVLSPEDE